MTAPASLHALPAGQQAQAMVLAAGRGQRMRPLTDHTPKPLLPVRGCTLLLRQVQALARGGFERVLINTAWLGEQIEAHMATAALPGVHTLWSREGQDFGNALETLGGICRALPQLDEVFWVLAADVFVPDFAYTQQAMQRFTASGMLGHLWLVRNPPQHPGGDFGLAAPVQGSGNAVGQALAQPQLGNSYTYSTIGLYRRALFEPPHCAIAPGNPAGLSASLAPLLRQAMAQGHISAQVYTGAWADVGTPERLAQLNASH